MELRKAIQQITGTEPSDAQIQKVMAIAHALEIPSNDAMMAVLAMLDAYVGIYTELPANVSKSIEKIASDAASIAESDMQQTMIQVKADLASAVSETAQKVASQVATKGMWQWAAICVVSAALVLGAFGMVMHKNGYEDGLATGQKIAREKTAAAVWATSAEGLEAYKMSKTGYLQLIETCNNPGWKTGKDDTVCYPLQAKNGTTYGWELP